MLYAITLIRIAMDCQTVSMKSSKFRYNKHLIVEKHSAAMKNSFSLRKSANNQSSSHLVLWKNRISMKKFYLNKYHELNGKREVHREDCYWLGFVQFKVDLGYHIIPELAIVEARRKYPQAMGCKFCTKDKFNWN